MKKIIPLIAIILLAGIAQGVSAASVDWDRTMLDLGNVVPGGTIFGSATVVSTGINNNVRIVEQDVSLDPLYPNSPYYRLYGLINITSPPGRGEIYDIVELGTLGDGQRVNVEFKCEPRQNLPPGDYWATFSVNSTEDVPGSILNVTCIVLPSSPDIQPPTVSSVTPTTAIQGQPQTYRVTATDNVGVVSCNFFWDSVDKGAMTLVSGNAQNGVWAKTYTENVAGTHVAKAECRDAANNLGIGPDTNIEVTPRQCTGNVRLLLSPNPVQRGGRVTATVYGLSSECAGKDALIRYKSSNGPLVTKCTLTSSGMCRAFFIAPGQPGFHPYFALVDKNNDGRYDWSFGEIGYALLKVLGWGWPYP